MEYAPMQDELVWSPQEQAHFEDLGQDFLIEILRAETDRYPENADALAELGHLYTRAGRHDEGLEVDRRLVRLMPNDATARYNLGCSLALLGESDAALDELEAAAELGYVDAAFLDKDEDLASLHGEVRFQRLIERLSGVNS